MNTNNLIPLEQNGQRVLLTSQLAESYGTTPEIISNNFNRNKTRYEVGKHYFVLEDDAKRDFLNHHQFDDGLKKAAKLYLWTERGALLHAKSLNTDRAWEVYDELVETYFRTTELLKSGTASAKPVKPGKTKEQLEAEAKRANAMLINAKNKVADRFQKLWDRANVQPEYQALALEELFAGDGIKLPRIALAGTKVTYDKGTIADKLGILSRTGKPHAQAVGVIISHLSIEEDEKEAIPFYRNGHDGTDIQYTESVIQKVKDWLDENGYPLTIFGTSGKAYAIEYREAV